MQINKFIIATAFYQGTDPAFGYLCRFSKSSAAYSPDHREIVDPPCFSISRRWHVISAKSSNASMVDDCRWFNTFSGPVFHRQICNDIFSDPSGYQIQEERPIVRYVCSL